MSDAENVRQPTGERCARDSPRDGMGDVWVRTECLRLRTAERCKSFRLANGGHGDEPMTSVVISFDILQCAISLKASGGIIEFNGRGRPYVLVSTN